MRFAAVESRHRGGAATVNGHWHCWRMGTRPSVRLVADPRIRAIRCGSGIDWRHALYKRACRLSTRAGDTVGPACAFVLCGAPLIVTEVVLPVILALALTLSDASNLRKMMRLESPLASCCCCADVRGDSGLAPVAPSAAESVDRRGSCWRVFMSRPFVSDFADRSRPPCRSEPGPALAARLIRRKSLLSAAGRRAAFARAAAQMLTSSSRRGARAACLSVLKRVSDARHGSVRSGRLPMAFAAHQGQIGAAWVLSLGNIFWRLRIHRYRGSDRADDPRRVSRRRYYSGVSTLRP